MICVKYEAGCLGNFLCQVLIGREPSSELDYGLKNKKDVLHPGIHFSAEDIHHNSSKDYQLKKAYDQKTFKIISHNAIEFENFFYSKKDLDFVFVELNSNFVEYKLNCMIKMPEWQEKLNLFAKNISWKNFDKPVAFDEARRITRLHKNLEQLLKKNKRDIVHNFKNFYLDQEPWIIAMSTLSKKLNLELDQEYLSSWYVKFQQGQKQVIERAKKIYECIENRKFVSGLNENEKGIIIGYEAVAQKEESPCFYNNIYEQYSK